MNAQSITPAEHARLAQEIRAAEHKTSAEIYVVIAHSADDFRLVPILWATGFALILPWILWLVAHLTLGTILPLQVLSFLVLAVALSPSRIRYQIVPPGIAADTAHRAALAQFMAHGVHLDSNRTAVLLYVSMLPRHIEVVADHAIHSKIDQQHWQHLVQLIRKDAQQGRLTDGLAAAVRAAGDVLAREFPANAGSRTRRGGLVEN